MSNKSLLASSLGVGPARGQGSHLQLSSSPARVRGGGEPKPELCNSARRPSAPLSSDSVSTRTSDQSKCVQESACLSTTTPQRSERTAAPPPRRLGGAGCALQSAAAARDRNFLQWPELSVERRAAHTTHIRACFLSSAAQKPGRSGWGHLERARTGATSSCYLSSVFPVGMRLGNCGTKL